MPVEGRRRKVKASDCKAQQLPHSILSPSTNDRPHRYTHERHDCPKQARHWPHPPRGPSRRLHATHLPSPRISPTQTTYLHLQQQSIPQMPPTIFPSVRPGSGWPSLVGATFFMRSKAPSSRLPAMSRT